MGFLSPLRKALKTVKSCKSLSVSFTHIVLKILFIEIPEHWSQQKDTDEMHQSTSLSNPQFFRKTLSQLKIQNKLCMLPSKTFDLNGDGYVSQKEFRIAKQFDTDKDGVLNKDEKAKCLKALKDGWEVKELRRQAEKKIGKGALRQSRAENTETRVCHTEVSPQKTQNSKVKTQKELFALRKGQAQSQEFDKWITAQKAKQQTEAECMEKEKKFIQSTIDAPIRKDAGTLTLKGLRKFSKE